MGIPASSKAFINSATLAGVSSGPLTIAVQPAANAAAKAKTQTKKGGGGEGYKAYQERMGKKGNGKVGGHTKSHKGVSQSDRETGKFSGGKQKGNKGPNQGGSIHG